MSKIIKTVSGKQKKQIDAAVKKARPNGNGKVPVTAQQSIPFKQMFKDGICKVDDNLYTKTVQFFDINYQLAQNEDKTAIFENYCDFLNYFDSSITVQLSFLNQVADVEEFHSQLEIEGQDDEFNDIREEYSEMWIVNPNSTKNIRTYISIQLGSSVHTLAGSSDVAGRLRRAETPYN